jgi:uncharacterized protein (DUF2235 family)
VHPDDSEAVTFRKMYAREVRIKFLGVWDTVGALGIPIRSLNWLTRRKYQFHDVQLSRIVDQRVSRRGDRRTAPAVQTDAVEASSS